MEEFFTNLHIGWWFLAQTLIILVCFISIDNYAYKRTMLFAEAFEDVKSRLDILETRTAKLIQITRNLDRDYDVDYEDEDEDEDEDY